MTKGTKSDEEERQLRAIFEGSSPEDGHGTYGEWLGEYAGRLVSELAEAAGMAATASDPNFTTFLPSGEDSKLAGLMDIAPLYSCLMSSLNLTSSNRAMPFSLAGALVSEMEELVSQVDIITREAPWNRNYTTNFDELDVRFLLGARLAGTKRDAQSCELHHHLRGRNGNTDLHSCGDSGRMSISGAC